MEKQQLTTDDHHLLIIGRLREAFPKASRHKKFDKRAIDVFRAALPEYEVSTGSVGDMVLTLKVWQGWNYPGTTLDYDNRFSMSWSTYEVPWTENFLQELSIQDPSDRIEREKQEAILTETFAVLEKQVKALQETASQLIKSLPIPKAAIKANIRASSTFWDTPTSSTRERFPLLFGK